MTEKKCNICGKTLDVYDKELGFSFHKAAPYGSQYDGAIFNLDLCCDCFDILISCVRNVSETDPIVGEGFENGFDDEYDDEYDECDDCECDCDNCKCLRCEKEHDEKPDNDGEFGEDDIDEFFDNLYDYIRELKKHGRKN